MAKLPIIDSKEFLELLIKYGCKLISTKGSHHKINYPLTGKTTVLAVHPGQDVDRGTFGGVISQLGINLNDFLKFNS